MVGRAAQSGLCQAHWTEQILQILAETERNLPKLLKDANKAERRLKAARLVAALRTAFPGAPITGYESEISRMTNDPSDRHVAAAALFAHVDAIITLRDCWSAGLNRKGVREGRDVLCEYVSRPSRNHRIRRLYRLRLIEARPESASDVSGSARALCPSHSAVRARLVLAAAPVARKAAPVGRWEPVLGLMG